MTSKDLSQGGDVEPGTKVVCSYVFKIVRGDKWNEWHLSACVLVSIKTQTWFSFLKVQGDYLFIECWLRSHRLKILTNN